MVTIINHSQGMKNSMQIMMTLHINIIINLCVGIHIFMLVVYPYLEHLHNNNDHSQ